MTLELLWRLAQRLFQDHQPGDDHQTGGPADAVRTCRTCGQPWPCSGRRLADLGLNTAETY